jgi:hypothetical protein
MQDIRDIAVRILHRHHVGRAVGGAIADLGGERNRNAKNRTEAEKKAAEHALM